jgi:hypothetical protein
MVVFFARDSNQTSALRLLACELTCLADCLTFSRARFLRWLLLEPSMLHLAEDAFPLHLLFSAL